MRQTQASHSSKIRAHCTRLFALLSVLLIATDLHSQASDTASRRIEPLIFGGITETQTGLEGGRNLSTTAGLDLRVPDVRSVALSIEVRASIPFDRGQVAGEKSAAFGIQVAAPRGRVRPFVNVLVGRMQVNYLNGGFVAPGTNRAYTFSASYLSSSGAGILFQTDNRFSFRADLQYQISSSPVTASGRLGSIPITLGLAYTLPGTRHGRPYP